MPELSYQGLGALLILLPGFLTAELVSILATRPKRTELEKVVQAFIYSFLIYICFSAVKGKFPISLRVENVAGAQRYIIEPHVLPLAELASIALALGVLIAYVMNHDFPLSLFRRGRITQRTFRGSVWNDTFHTLSGYVQVELADGRHVIGWLLYYSDTAEESSLLLQDAAWITDNGQEVPIDGPGILLTKESGIRSVMFLNPIIEQQGSGI